MVNLREMLPFFAAGTPVGYENLASRTKKVAEHCTIGKCNPMVSNSRSQYVFLVIIAFRAIMTSVQTILIIQGPLIAHH